MNEKTDNKKSMEEVKKIVLTDKIIKEYNSETKKKDNTEIEDKISLNELITFLKKCKGKEITNEAYLVFIDNLDIKKYLPMETKMKLLLNLVIHLTYTEGFVSELAAIDVEVRKAFYCLLAYTNVDLETVEKTPLTFEMYDLLIDSGLYDDIMKIAGKDYQRLENLIEQAFKFESMFQTYMNMGNIDYQDMKENLKTAQDFLNNFSSEDLEHFANIATINDPLIADLAKMVRENKLL